MMMGDRKLVSAVPPIRGNNQLMLIVGGGGDKRGRGMIVGDRMTEKGRGGGNLVETFELHEITSLPYFCTPRSTKKTGTYFACVLGVRLLCQRHGQLVFWAQSEG